MPNYAPSTRLAVADINHGLRVDKTAASIVTGQNAYFNVKGGMIFMIDLIGFVTTDIQAAATLLHWDTTPDVGAAAALCIDSGDLTGTAAGSMLILPAAAGSALTVPSGAYLKLFPIIGWVISPGTIDLHASATRTGVIRWSLWYIPLYEAAYVEAA
jgi:hypothetical protein